MDALQITRTRAIPHHNWLFVDRKLQQIAWQLVGKTLVAQNVRRLHRPTIQFRNSYHNIPYLLFRARSDQCERGRNSLTYAGHVRGMDARTSEQLRANGHGVAQCGCAPCTNGRTDAGERSWRRVMRIIGTQGVYQAICVENARLGSWRNAVRKHGARGYRSNRKRIYLRKERLRIAA